MDELGYLDDPAPGWASSTRSRCAPFAWSSTSACTWSCRSRAPSSPQHRGRDVDAGARAPFFGAHCGRPAAFLDSEIVRYLGCPGQAISYKLGERAWLAGRDAARAARGADFDLAAWHAAALSLGALGLDDLADELARL